MRALARAAALIRCRAAGLRTNHAIAAAIREALEAKAQGRSRTILFGLSGHGHFDMQSYIDYNAGKLENYDYPEEEIAMALAGLPAVR